MVPKVRRKYSVEVKAVKAQKQRANPMSSYEDKSVKSYFDYYGKLWSTTLEPLSARVLFIVRCVYVVQQVHHRGMERKVQNVYEVNP